MFDISVSYLRLSVFFSARVLYRHIFGLLLSVVGCRMNENIRIDFSGRQMWPEECTDDMIRQIDPQTRRAELAFPLSSMYSAFFRICVSEISDIIFSTVRANSQTLGFVNYH